MTQKRILIFAAKQVGFGIIKYLIEFDAPIHKVIVAGEAERDILDITRNAGFSTEIYNAETQSRLAGEGNRFKWLLNLWSPHILKAPVLALAENSLNVHPSLVPHCRGNDNAAWTIINRFRAGVSLIEMVEEVDAGDIFAQKEVPYEFPVRGSQLHQRLQQEAVEFFKEQWPAIFSEKIRPKPQEGGVTIYKRKQTEENRVLDASTSMSLGEFVKWIMAHDFTPGTTAEMARNGEKYMLTLNIKKKQQGR